MAGLACGRVGGASHNKLTRKDLSHGKTAASAAFFSLLIARGSACGDGRSFSIRRSNEASRFWPARRDSELVIAL